MALEGFLGSRNKCPGDYEHEPYFKLARGTALNRGLSGTGLIKLDLIVLPPLTIQTATKSGSAFTLSWRALMGRAYQVQFKTDLAQPTWINLVLRLTATNTTMTAVDSAVTDSQRFYRVLLLP